jgi:hypothetical protein
VDQAVMDPYAVALPSHGPFHTAKGCTLSVAKQVLSGWLDSVIKDCGTQLSFAVIPRRLRRPGLDGL